MREILFRAKTKQGEWVYWNELGVINFDLTDMEIALYVKDLNDELMFETIGQFTGLTDKNGKKIFEGDIIKIHRKYLNAGCEEDCLYEVIWHKHWCGWALRNLKPTQCCYLSDAKDGKIIGNKWDNPELLGE